MELIWLEQNILLQLNLDVVTLRYILILDGYYLGNGLMNSCLNFIGLSVNPIDAD